MTYKSKTRFDFICEINSGVISNLFADMFIVSTESDICDIKASLKIKSSATKFIWDQSIVYSAGEFDVSNVLILLADPSAVSLLFAYPLFRHVSFSF